MSDLSDSDRESDIQPSPLANPPATHKLNTHKYDSYDDLIDDLHDYAAQAGFSESVGNNGNGNRVATRVATGRVVRATQAE